MRRRDVELQLRGQRALVTASTGGIGLEIARVLAREAAEVIVNGRTSESVERAVRTIRDAVPAATLRGLAADNGTADGGARTTAEHPEVDILVNNLGIYEAVGFFDASDDQWRRLFEVNILSGVRLTRHYLRRMLDRNAGGSCSSPASRPSTPRPRWPTTARPRRCSSPSPEAWPS